MSKKNLVKNIKPETLQGVIAVVCFIIAIISILASLGKAGIVGNSAYNLLTKLFGIGYFLIPIILSMLGVAFFRSVQIKFEFLRLVGSIVFFISGLGIIDIIASGKSGVVGHYISLPLVKLFDVYASCFILGGLILISSLIVLDTKLNIHYIYYLMFWRLFKKKIK